MNVLTRKSGANNIQSTTIGMYEEGCHDHVQSRPGHDEGWCMTSTSTSAEYTAEYTTYKQKSVRSFQAHDAWCLGLWVGCHVANIRARSLDASGHPNRWPSSGFEPCCNLSLLTRQCCMLLSVPQSQISFWYITRCILWFVSSLPHHRSLPPRHRFR